MDDDTKIKALMVYFRHWGVDEARARKNIHGIRKTETILQENFSGIHKMDMSNPTFWSYLIEALLSGMNHYTPYDDLGDMKMLYARARFASDIGANFFNVHLNNADKDMMRRVNAIVALPFLP